jgi:2-oxo-4-hydroxy-4-carboxy-5-ureidoimidazoline decarboxylase
MPRTLAEFNALPAAAARQALLACCSAARWAAEVTAGRPFGTLDDVLRRSDAAVSGLTEAELSEALAGHPRIGRPEPAGPAGPGEPGTGQPGTGQPGTGQPETGRPGWSRREQSGVNPADQATMQALADGNQAYERRFGHLYLVCATGRSGPELLALLQQRLGNDPAAEWRVVRAELEKINRIRLAKLLAGPSAPDASGGSAR